MPCLVALLAFFAPRLTMILMVIFGDYLGRAYETTLWPLAGFFFAPYTTLAYAYSVNTSGHGVFENHPIIMVLAILLDVGVFGGGASSGHSRAKHD